MSASDLTVRERCDLYCAPTGSFRYGFDAEGDVFRCEHGTVRRCCASTGWGHWDRRRNWWTRLSPVFNPIRYPRALRALSLEEAP